MPWNTTVALKANVHLTAIVQKKMWYITAHHQQHSNPKHCILALQRVSLKNKDITTTAKNFETRTISRVQHSPVMIAKWRKQKRKHLCGK